MRLQIVFFWSLALTLSARLVVVAAQDSIPHLRMLDGRLDVLLDYGIRHSPTLRALVDRLDEASVLVFTECGTQMPMGVGAYLHLVTVVDGVRYVRVAVDCSLGDKARIALFAHEFQHALEIASDPSVIDNESMGLYFESIGFQTQADGSHKAYETEAAMRLQRRVTSEINWRGFNRQEPRGRK